MNNIVRITKKKNVKVRNIHNDIVFPYQNILVVEFENGKDRIIDLMSEKDITDIDYLEIMETPKTTYRKVFEDSDFFTIPF